MTPDQVKRQSMWEFEAALTGWNDAHSSGEAARLSVEDGDDLWQGVMERMQ